MGWPTVDRTKRSEEELCDPETQLSKGQENIVKEGIEMATTQSALKLDNQNEMVNKSYHDARIPSRCTDGIQRMLCRLIKGQSAPDIGIEDFNGNSLNFSILDPCSMRL